MRLANFLLLLGLFAFTWTGCKKDEDDNNNTDGNQMLVIETGARTLSPDASLTYRAVLLDVNGNRTPANNVTWTSSETGVATIAASGAISVVSTGFTTIRASVQVGGRTLTAEAPLSIAAPSIFTVVPGAILVDVGFPDIELIPFYLGTGNPSFSYQSSNPSIASVSANGVVDFRAVGTCQITVTANGLDGNPSVVVPVMVIGVPEISLPVVRVQVSPSAYAMLRNETQQFTARAFNSRGEEVTGQSITWTVENGSVANIDATGRLTASGIGETKVYATVAGVVGEAEIEVVPNQVLIVEPYYVTIAAGSSRQFTVRQYPVVRVNGELALGSGTTPSNITWEIPTFGISLFDIATVNSSGLVTVRSDAMAGLTSFVMAYIAGNEDIEPGIGVIAVPIGTPCDCGTALPQASSIRLNSARNLTLSLFSGPSQISADVLDAQGNVLSSAQLNYCSSDVQVASVGFSGEVNAAGFTAGSTATVTVCHGSLREEITVTIQ